MLLSCYQQQTPYEAHDMLRRCCSVLLDIFSACFKLFVLLPPPCNPRLYRCVSSSSDHFDSLSRTNTSVFLRPFLYTCIVDPYVDPMLPHRRLNIDPLLDQFQPNVDQWLFHSGPITDLKLTNNVEPLLTHC